MLYIGLLGLIATIFLLIKYVLQSRTYSEDNEKIKEKKESGYDKKMTDLIPIIDYDSELNCYMYNDGTLMDLMQIKSQNLADLSNDEREFMNLKYSRWYKKYAPDIKLIMMNFPSDMTEQKKYWEHKFSNTKNETFQNWQQKKISELNWIEKNRTSREFYFMFWGKNREDFLKNREQHLESLGTGPLGYIEYIDKDKKNSILFKFNNMCSIVNHKEKHEKKD